MFLKISKTIKNHSLHITLLDETYKNIEPLIENKLNNSRPIQDLNELSEEIVSSIKKLKERID